MTSISDKVLLTFSSLSSYERLMVTGLFYFSFPLFFFFSGFLFPGMSHKAAPSRVETGAQSGNETQYVFCEGDVRDSDADPQPGRHLLGLFEFLFPPSIKLCRYYYSQRNTFVSTA